jgi:hypothetical protein
MWHVWGEEGRIEGFQWEDLMQRDDLEYTGIDGRIILKCILKKWIGEAWTGLVWLRMRRGGGRLRMH